MKLKQFHFNTFFSVFILLETEYRRVKNKAKILSSTGIYKSKEILSFPFHFPKHRVPQNIFSKLYYFSFCF